jgi:FKBP-type peptidyl-prolyl cis-trans isomerase FkpA
MSVANAANQTARTGRATGLWLAFVLIIGAGIGLAWIGAGPLRPLVTESGLRFRTIKPGAGDLITQNDAALMDYILTVNGKVVDASDSHGGPQALAAGTTYPGFAEAMTHMQEGGVYRFTMPPRLAFGEKPPPQGFPAGNLTFDTQVRKVVRGGAGMLMQAGGPTSGKPPQ